MNAAERVPGVTFSIQHLTQAVTASYYMLVISPRSSCIQTPICDHNRQPVVNV
jgi:hypothetical protein